MSRPSRLQASAFADAYGVHRSTVTGQSIAQDDEILELADL